MSELEPASMDTEPEARRWEQPTRCRHEHVEEVVAWGLPDPVARICTDCGAVLWANAL